MSDSCFPRSVTCGASAFAAPAAAYVRWYDSQERRLQAPVGCQPFARARVRMPLPGAGAGALAPFPPIRAGAAGALGATCAWLPFLPVRQPFAFALRFFASTGSSSPLSLDGSPLSTTPTVSVRRLGRVSAARRIG